MDALSGILFFTSGFVTAATVSGLVAAAVLMRMKDREQARVDDGTTRWAANVMRMARWPSDEAAQRATEP